jgi:glucosamine-6-phosphate deaminase
MEATTMNQLTVLHYTSRLEMGKAVAADVAAKIKELLEQKSSIAVVFASAPSQNEFLDALQEDESIPWERIVCFHLDEYVGLPADAPQSFSLFLKEKLFNSRKPKQFNVINGLNDPKDECTRYSELLASYSIDIACIGIGENGHIAFNDPHVADFNDPLRVKSVMLDETSRVQQVNDGCFDVLDNVPVEAITLTIPTILSASSIFCTVPGERKSKAVQETLYGPVDIRYPATALRKAASCRIYLDEESASLL